MKTREGAGNDFKTKEKRGQVNGAARYWWSGPQGAASVLTTANRVSTAVDFTGAAGGVDAMLVTTGKAEGTPVKLGNTTLTLKFIPGNAAPIPVVEGDKVVIGKQTVSLRDGNLVLGTATRP